MELYLLQDGTHVVPGDVSPDKKGVLRSKGGLAVCLYEDGTPQTVTRDAVINKNVLAASTGEDFADPAKRAEKQDVQAVERDAVAKAAADKKGSDHLLATTTNTATVAPKKPV